MFQSKLERSTGKRLPRPTQIMPSRKITMKRTAANNRPLISVWASPSKFRSKADSAYELRSNFDHVPHEILVRAVQHISKRFEHVALWIDAYLAVVSEGIGPSVGDERPQNVPESAANGFPNDQEPPAAEDCEMPEVGQSGSEWPQSPRFSPLRSPRSPEYVPGSAWNSAFT